MGGSKEKKLVKKAIKILAGSQIIFFLIFIIMICSLALVLQKNKNSDGGFGDFSDIGALGVPIKLVPYFNEASEVIGIPNWVLAAVAKKESGFRPEAASSDGAYGLMQIQKIDHIGNGADLWQGLIDVGLGEEYKKLGYKFSGAADMWSIYLRDARAQAIAGAYEMRYYANYVLWRKGLISNLDYNSKENLKLINWKANENDSTFKELLKRTFACYNGGPDYGMNVNFNSAENNYPNEVFKFAMEFRSAGLTSAGGSGIKGDNKTIEKAIEAGMKWVGKSPYCFGGGRTQSQIDAGVFDCSSLVHYCYKSAGIELGDVIGVTTFSLLNYGKKVSPKDMKRGDLIFFDTYVINGHVGIYLGDGKMLNDNSTQGVWIDDLNTPYQQSTINGEVRRIVN